MSIDCTNCSDCCKDITLPLGMVFDKDDIRWIEYHGLKVTEKNGKQWVKIPNQCEKLKDNKCSIYKDRPEQCQIFVCQK